MSSGVLYFLKKMSIKNQFAGFQNEQFTLPFNVADPDTTYIMPKALKEISGLSYLDTNQVLTVNDEKGFLYTYDFTEGKVVSKIDFGKKGDYESVTRKNNIVYIAESNGNLKVVDLKQGKKIMEYDTPLSRKNNVEGLCFDENRNQLLMVCKGRLEKKSRNRKIKGIYSFDLTTNKFIDNPFKLINLNEERENLLPLNLTNDQLSNFTINSRLKSFAPSAMAIDPINSNIYILSTRGGILTVMDSNRALLGIYFLSRHTYGQPEGITFDQDGNMYISNEAKSTKANILKILRS